MELAKQAGREFGNQTYAATAALDLVRLRADVSQAKALIAGISDTKVNIGADATDLERTVKKSTADINKLDAKGAEIKIKGDRSDWSREWLAAQAEAEALDRWMAEIQIDGDRSDWTQEQRAASAEVINLNRKRAEIPIDGNTRGWDTKKRGIFSDIRLIGGMRPSVLIAWKDDFFNSSARLIRRQISSIGGMRPRVVVKENFMDSARRANVFSRSIDTLGNKALSVSQTFSGKDQSIARKIVGFVSAVAGIGGAATSAATGMAKLADGGSNVAGAATKAGGGMGGLASSIAMAGGSAFISAAAFGVLLAAIMPIIAILVTGVATIAAVAAGFALIGAAGVQLAKDFGTVSAANNRVEDAQYALNQAMKAGEKDAKSLGDEEKKLAGLEKQQKAAKEDLSRAWDRLNKARDPKNTQAVAQAERGLGAAQKAQDAATSRLDTAWNKLNSARDSKKPRAIAAAEREIAAAEKEEERTTKALDSAFTALDKARSPNNARAIARAEGEIEASQKRVDKTTQAVERAQKKLNDARKDGTGMRILEAERELGKAQNAQAIALKNASGGSEEYAKALNRVHKEASLLGPAFRKAFTPAATQLGNLTADAMQFGRKALPLIGSASAKATREMKEGFDAGHKSSTRLRDVIDPLPAIMGDIGGTTRNLKSAWTSFMDVALPYVKDFTQWVEDASRRLASWADSEKGRRDIAMFLDLAVPMAKALGDFFKNVGDKLYDLAVKHGPMVVDLINAMTEAVDFLVGVLDAALDIATKLLNIWKQVNEFARKNNKGNSKKGHQGSTDGSGNPTHAYGGDQVLYTAAHGLSEAGAHFVNGPTMASAGNTDVLYGEALSQGNREYAFPMDNGSMRFITEEPGYDGSSYALWRDLGQRQGYFAHNTDPAPKAPSLSAAASRPQAASSAMGGVESRLDSLNATQRDGFNRVERATHAVPEGVREGIDHNLEHGRPTRTSVLKGLSRETRRRQFEGTI